ncbi:hypothetical protein ACLRGF_12030 [Mycetocola zhadangensis]|uniref:hypothetical protein n=1 Tax=Mycetocola zhadangensis TaxID=1164595 RepID=UPI003A4D4F2D
MLDSRDIGGLQGAPVHGPDNEKIGNVNQVFVDAVTGAPNWVTLKTGFLGRHEIFAPLANATWDGEVLRTELDKETLLAAPRLNADEGLSPHNEEALNRHFGLSDVDTDGGTARPTDDYPEHPELMEQAAARQREEEAANADRPIIENEHGRFDDTRDDGDPTRQPDHGNVTDPDDRNERGDGGRRTAASVPVDRDESFRGEGTSADTVPADTPGETGRTPGPRHAKRDTTL